MYETNVRPELHGNAQSYATTTFASNADLQWPPVHTLMTSLPSTETFAAAAALVPFDAPGMDLSCPARAHPTPTQAKIKGTAEQREGGNTTLQLTLGDLGDERIKRLLKEQPNTVIKVQLNAKTAVALLDRTDLFAAGAPAAASAAPPSPPDSAGDVPARASRSTASTETASLYWLEDGCSLEYKGQGYGDCSKVLYDTGSEIGLMSQSYADAQGFMYNACATQIATSLGGVGSVVGIVDAPVRCMLNANTSVEAKTRSTPATQFLAVKGVEHMYDMLVSHTVRRIGVGALTPLPSCSSTGLSWQRVTCTRLRQSLS